MRCGPLAISRGGYDVIAPVALYFLPFGATHSGSADPEAKQEDGFREAVPATR